MSLPEYESAHDEMLGLFKAAWDANAPALNGGSAPVVYYPGTEKGTPGQDLPAPDAPAARIRIVEASGRQNTFGKTGERKFVRRGTVTTQVFAPLSGNDPYTLAQKLAIIARNAFEGVGTDSGIWFRNVRMPEIGPDGVFYQINVIAEYEYDEMR